MAIDLELTVTEADGCPRIDVYLKKHLPEEWSRSAIQKALKKGYIKLNGGLSRANVRLNQGQKLQVSIPDGFIRPASPPAESRPLNIFYEDDSLLVINKPSGLVVHPSEHQWTGTLVNALKSYTDQLSDDGESSRPGIVHRLDQDTSGLLVVAKDNITHTLLAKQFQRRTIYKQYVAFVQGQVLYEEGVIKEAIGRDPRRRDKMAVVHEEEGRQAQTMYRVLQRFDDQTLVRLYPKTGRTHQLRVHMAHIKHPIIGDVKYGQRRTWWRLGLHAQSIGFWHPHSKRFVQFHSELPEDFVKHRHTLETKA